MSDSRLGRQGGDRRSRATVRLDLSTCVNPYGPPPGVMTLLRSLPKSVVRDHPYEAAADVERSYAEHLGRPIEEFVATRGTSEMIWILAREWQGHEVGLPMPTYTEFRRAFGWATAYGGGPSTHPAEVLDDAMRRSDAVILSNPHNPTGQIVERHDLVQLAADYPSTTIVVDESYIEFLPEGGAVTLVGCGLENVVVLRSPSKFYALAGIRSGVAWSHGSLQRQAEAWRTPWPVSALAAAALECAIREQAWASETRDRLASDGTWLEGLLAESELDVAPGRLHFRLATGSAQGVAQFACLLEAHGIVVRILGDGHGVGRPALRIAAPRCECRGVLTAAMGSSC